MTVAAIHQPTYLPWLGFFHKVRVSDVFILLDDVQFPKQGGNWINRCRINASGVARWMSVPVQRPSGLQLVSEVSAADNRWPQEHARILELHYRNAPCFGEVRELCDRLYASPGRSLFEFNVNAISEILDLIDPFAKRKIVRSSTLGVSSTGTKRLVELAHRVGASMYVSGDGSDGYLDPEEFNRGGVALRYQGFSEVPRPQLGTTEFIRGLSIVDALMMVGASGVSSLIDGASRTSE
jgi:hypothetical protein